MLVGRGALAAGSLVVVLALGSHLYFLAFEILFQVFHKRIQIIASHMKPIVLVFILMKGVNSKATYFLPHIHIGFWSLTVNPIDSISRIENNMSCAQAVAATNSASVTDNVVQSCILLCITIGAPLKKHHPSAHTFGSCWILGKVQI